MESESKYPFEKQVIDMEITYKITAVSV